MTETAPINSQNQDEYSYGVEEGFQDLSDEFEQQLDDEYSDLGDGSQVLQNSDEGWVTLEMIRELEGKLDAAHNLPNFEELSQILDEAEKFEAIAERSEKFAGSESLQRKAVDFHQKAQAAFEMVSDGFAEASDHAQEEDGDFSHGIIKGDRATYAQKNGVVHLKTTFSRIKRHEITGPVEVRIQTDAVGTKVKVEKDQPEIGMRTIKILRREQDGTTSTETFIVHEAASKILIDGPLPDVEGNVSYDGEPYRSAMDPKISFIDEPRRAVFDYDLKKVTQAIGSVNYGKGGAAATAVFIAWDKAIKTGDWDPVYAAALSTEYLSGNDMVGALIYGLLVSYDKEHARQLLTATPVGFRKRLIKLAMEEMDHFNGALTADGLNMDLRYDPNTGRADWGANRSSGPGTRPNPNYLGPDQPLDDMATTADMVIFINSTIPDGRLDTLEDSDDFQMEGKLQKPQEQK